MQVVGHIRVRAKNNSEFKLRLKFRDLQVEFIYFGHDLNLNFVIRSQLHYMGATRL